MVAMHCPQKPIIGSVMMILKIQRSIVLQRSFKLEHNEAVIPRKEQRKIFIFGFWDTQLHFLVQLNQKGLKLKMNYCRAKKIPTGNVSNVSAVKQI